MFKNRLLTQVFWLGALLAPTIATAQDLAAENPSDLVARMMKFDKNTDGKLTKAEITDVRLVRLWTRADADGDGSVTRGELEALENAEKPTNRNPLRAPGGGMGGPGGPMGPPPKPGEVLPAMVRTRLNLTADQQTQIDTLQRDVDARLAQILTESQKTQIKQMSTRGPGGGRGGPGPDEGGFPPPPPR